MSPFYILAALAAMFFAGRMYGIVEGQRRKDERIERQRGIEIKHLLDHIGITWK